MNTLLEVCAGSIESVYAAHRGGAYRVELCSGLDEGGLTPSTGFVEAALSVPNLKKNVLIRPRGGDFLYSRREGEVMIKDIEHLKAMGVDGVVVGALESDGRVDLALMRKLMLAADGMDVTFHRAFDMCCDPLNSLEEIIDLGCSRILTSGQTSTAEAGIPQLKKLIEHAAGRISIMPGCGVDASNAAQIVRMTGALEIHASARTLLPSRMLFQHRGVEMGKKGGDEFFRKETSEIVVRNIVDSLKNISSSELNKN